MTKMLIVEQDEETSSLLQQKFAELGNEVDLSPLEEAFESFENSMPDLVLMDFDWDYNKAKAQSRQILEMDHTACIFALTKRGPEATDELYKAGVRVVVHPKGESVKENIDEFLDDMYKSCNDLEHEKCIGCWETGRFDDLQQI